jgi:hypothetical protein
MGETRSLSWAVSLRSGGLGLGFGVDVEMLGAVEAPRKNLPRRWIAGDRFPTYPVIRDRVWLLSIPGLKSETRGTGFSRSWQGLKPTHSVGFFWHD